MTAIVPEHRTAPGRHLRELQVILASASARAAAVVARTVPAATCGPPLHVHAACHEIFFIVSGELLVHADGHVATIREGGLVHVRCGMPHTFATTPGTPARFLVLSTTRPDPMTAALAGRHRHAGIRSFVDDPVREPEPARSRTIAPSSPGYNPNTPMPAKSANGKYDITPVQARHGRPCWRPGSPIISADPAPWPRLVTLTRREIRSGS